MEEYKFENGDLELLAMGLLPVEEESALLALMEANEILKAEYVDIEDALFLTSSENRVEPTLLVKDGIVSRIFAEEKPSFLFKVSATNILRLAAALLLVGSVSFNLFLLNAGSKSKTVVENKVEQISRVDLPFEEEIFKEMFIYLKDELSKEPCAMDFRTTKEFLTIHNLDTPENLSFLQEHDGHCDCEVLLNVAQYFPDSKYHHGDILPKVHMASKPMAVSFLISTHH